MKNMQNESTTDRIIRAIVGLILLVVAYLLSGILSIILYVVAAVSLFTASTGFCALYKLFGYSTKK